MPDTAPTTEGKAKEEDRIDVFELCMAIMLGLGAVGGAWAGFQGDLWGGKQAENYGLASKEMARAASTMSMSASKMGEASTSVTEATSGISQILSVHSHNVNLDVQAKQHVIEGVVAREMANAGKQPAEAPPTPAPTERTPAPAPTAGAATAPAVEVPIETSKHFYVAKDLYGVQMDEEYYKAMGFPPEYRGTENYDKMPDDVLEKLGGEEIPDAVIEKKLEEPKAAMETASKTYEEVMAAQAEASKKQAEADTAFQEGGRANTIGDNLGFTGVLHTVALFLAGIGLVFKSKVKWGFGAMGLIALVVATIHLFMQEWTSSG